MAGADPPLETPADVPQAPAQRTKPCPECKGDGKVLVWLGLPEEACRKCNGTGTIEVVEEPLTPWQQEVLTLLREIRERVEHPLYQVTVDASDAGPLLPEIRERMRNTGKP